MWVLWICGYPPKDIHQTFLMKWSAGGDTSQKQTAGDSTSKKASSFPGCSLDPVEVVVWQENNIWWKIMPPYAECSDYTEQFVERQSAAVRRDCLLQFVFTKKLSFIQTSCAKKCNISPAMGLSHFISSRTSEILSLYLLRIIFVEEIDLVQIELFCVCEGTCIYLICFATKVTKILTLSCWTDVMTSAPKWIYLSGF